MAYNEFTLPGLKRLFGLQIEERRDLFAQSPSASVSAWLRETLDYQLPLALEISTEKARSELIIMPVLVETRRQMNDCISLFSGVEFNVDAESGLKGVCDYLLSLSPLQLAVEAPVIAIAEAKNENVPRGIAQCLAEMVAAQRFNREQENTIPTVFGVVTTGSLWKFLRLEETLATVDETEYHIGQPGKIVGILLQMVREAMESKDKSGM
ncbi:MAG TPA: hypothetical protein VKU00_16060 [Chthonomonadaceae bacterium]|nr:hypothetical protein [Chthonomonadaceae bacterium]